MKLKWFKLKGLWYIPQNVPGWIVALACVILAVIAFVHADRSSHSVSDTLINFFFYLLIIVNGYQVFGALTEDRSGQR